MVTNRGILVRIIKEIRKAKKSEKYKVYEKYDSVFEIDKKNQSEKAYWEISGETVRKFGTIRLYENKYSLSGNKIPRPAFFSKILKQEEKKLIMKNLPKNCKNCKFWRFFEIEISMSSSGNAFKIFCPNCCKRLDNF